jgi:hypothetical protein
VITADHIARETWRPVVQRGGSAELFALEAESGFSLPSFEIPVGSRVARELNERMKAAWNVDTFSLYSLSPAGRGNGIGAKRNLVMETVGPQATLPLGARWLRASDITDRDFSNPDDASAVRAWREEARTIGDGPFIGDKHFGLVRFETADHGLWFKAVGAPNVREFPITVTLSNLLPGYTAPILATEPDWNAWLAMEVPGVPLSEDSEMDTWGQAAHDLAAMQAASLGTAEIILKWQARDIRCSTLRDLVEPFFACLGELMDLQTSQDPRPLRSAEMKELESDTRLVLDDLQNQHAPETLVHLDLNPDNLIALPHRTVFLDWAEAGIGHPLLSFAHLLEHFRAQFPDSADAYAQLVRRYTRGWQGHGRFDLTERTICLALFLAVLAHAVSTDAWRDADRLREPRVAGYYRSLARRMNRYAIQIRHGCSNVSEVWNEE